MYFKSFQSTNTDSSLHKNFLKEKRQSGNIEASTSDESIHKSLTGAGGNLSQNNGFWKKPGGEPKYFIFNLLFANSTIKPSNK